MPKIGGNTIEECMEICMSDPKLREEVKDSEKRSEMCYAACMKSLDNEIQASHFEITHRDGKYIINGEENPGIWAARGQTYTFEINAEGHPFWIKTEMTVGSENAYNEGVKNNGTEVGTITFTVPSDAPKKLFYVCEFHNTMQGEIEILTEEQMKMVKLVEYYKIKLIDYI
jgi:plastocyanin